MVASVTCSIFEDHLTHRILTRLREAARMASSDLSANRLRLRELLDDLAYELDAGELALETLQRHTKSTASDSSWAGD